MKMPLGASTWCFNNIAPNEVRVVLDGGAAATLSSLPAVRAYFRELTETVLGSNIQAIELWFAEVLEDEDVVASLNRLAERGRIYSMHAPFGPLRDLASLDDEVRRRGIEGCNRAASLLNRFRGKTLVIHGSSGVVNASEKPER
ncbi:MAG: hypothetical protein QME62_09170, partial [Armatimonadota bacterium]|nr:hypothetical protein [Armatimonadota bacterium]